ncbi:MAG TPA: glycosyltransferase family 4 protein [Asanoa sp.]
MRIASLTAAGRRRAGLCVDAALRAATSAGAMRLRPMSALWARLLAAAALPEPVRGRMARRVAQARLRDGDALAAEATLRAAADRSADPRRRADLLLESLGAAAPVDGLRQGLPPVLREAVEADLAAADTAHLRGEPALAARAIDRAMAIQFHRELHFDRLGSPLAADPDGFLAPLRDSTAVRALAARGRARPAARASTDRPLRLLVATRTNASFLREIRDRYARHSGVEMRFLDLGADPRREPLTRHVEDMTRALLGDRSTPFADEVERWLRPHLDWSDTVLIDWCVSTAVLFTMVDPGDARIVVRLHSFELFTAWPHLVSFGRVDDMVVVSDHLRAFTHAVLPRARPRVHVIPNAVELHRFRRPKAADARFTLGLIGVGAVAKDPRWAIAVLRLLRRADARYRLLLVGALSDGPTASARCYQRLLASDLAELEPSGAVRAVGPTGDVPAALSAIGTILSSSVRESFHVALVEGAASGAVPVVRDWPFFVGRARGARSVFPDDWVVSTPEAAAERILALTADEGRWRTAGEEAAAYALATWDWSVVSRRWDDLLLSADSHP